MGNKILHNEAQERVIDEIYGQMVVVACPGSGKTTTILRRINNMIENEDIEPSEILMITFTKASATEMAERYVSMFGSNPGVTFCTIHALCMSFLKKFCNISPRCIIPDNYEILRTLVKSDDRYKSISDLDTFVRELQMDITVAKSRLSPVEEYVPKCCRDKDYFLDIYKRYELEKDLRGCLDYDDLLLRTYDLLKKDHSCVDYMKGIFSFIHVDEYQDTNLVQKEIVYAICGKNGNIAVVGDDDQSIYSFRGATPAVMQDFLQYFGAAKEINMVTNYRSDRKIIEAASKLVSHNTIRFEKDIKGASMDDGSISAVCYGTKKDELLHLGGDLLRLHSLKQDMNNVAVLYRTNAQAAQVAELLWQYKIPFYSNESIPDRYRNDMFYDMISYYRMSRLKEGMADQNAFVRTIFHPNRFFYNYRDMKFTDTAEEMKNKAYSGDREDWQNESTMAEIDRYHKLLCSIRLLPLKKALELIYAQGGYGKYLKEYADYRNIPFEDIQTQWEMYFEDIDRNNIKTFDEWEKYGSRFSIMLAKRQQEQDGVCLSTMHKSKGCEWDRVFMFDCNENICPYVKAVTREEIEEERRLFYVGMTRARHELKIYCCRQTKRDKKIIPSRFILEAGLTV